MICPVCNNSKNFTPIFPKFCNTNNYICHECGLVFIPRESETNMQDYYKDDGYFKQSPNISLRKEFVSPSMLIKQANKRIRIMAEIKPDLNFENKDILDIGCSYGEILYVLKSDFNANVVGLEPSPETAKIGRALFDIEIHTQILEEFSTKDKFDIILCNHTLEHVDDPKSFISDMAKLLKPHGYIYIEVPNILKPTGGFKLEKFLYNEHLQTFSADNLDLLFTKVNLNTRKYSDKGFLRFFIMKDKIKGPNKKPKSISYQEIIEFLNQYKANYSIIQTIKVYNYKLMYLLQLIYLKIFKDGRFDYSDKPNSK